MSPVRRDPLPWPTIGRLVATGFAIWIFVHTWQLWLLLLTALILAAAMLPAARWGDRWRIPRLVTVAGVYLAAALVFIVLGRFLVPALADQAAQFGRQLPALVDNVKVWAGHVTAWSERWDLPMPALPGGRGEGLGGVGQILLQNTLHATAGVIGAVVGFSCWTPST